MTTRRSSDGGMTMTDYMAGGSAGDAGRGLAGSRSFGAGGRGVRKPRSWHPSPYGSDEELLCDGVDVDDVLTREAKKQRIKAEIARRRQQIEQNSRLHDELVRLARLRESGGADVISLHLSSSRVSYILHPALIVDDPVPPLGVRLASIVLASRS